MGANESSSAKRDTTEETGGPPDYYALLQVEEQATSDEIRKSFRRLALIHHPDKNVDNVEEATQRFAELQRAYEVLSDDQERAWYDSHRASLVPEPDARTVFEDIKRGAPPPRARDRGLTVRHLQQFFDASIYSGFDDGPNGFFTIYRNLFSRLAHDESQFNDELISSSSSLPSFGESTWPWMEPSKDAADHAARTFYNYWLHFSTAKDFAWAEQWNLNEAPERRVRRLMEKDNKKARDDARKEYNETIRDLVTFLRKRDPRYKSHLARQHEAATAKSSKLSSSTLPSSSASPRSGTGTSTPTANNNNTTPPTYTYVEQEWQKVKPEGEADLEWAAVEEEEEEEWECVACNKRFRSEAQWDSHERSRKHMQAVEKLKKEMEEEDELFGLGEEEESREVESEGEEEVAGDEENENEDDAVDSVNAETVTVEEAEADTAHKDVVEDQSSTISPPPPLPRPNTRTKKSKPKSKQQNQPSRNTSPSPPRKSERKGRNRNRVQQQQQQQDDDDGFVGSDDVQLLNSGIGLGADGGGREEEEYDEEHHNPPVPTSASAAAAESSKPELSKREKRRAKEAAKKAQSTSAFTEHNKLSCNVCSTQFDSRTKLFSHIKETGHALAEPERGVGKKGKKEKGKQR
ncbi:Multifunctional chaperone and stress response protein [Abortiporus biennis]